MPTSKETGADGERCACLFLERRGYCIAETNWRFSRYEIDIIAWFDGLLVIVEVKTRSENDVTKPEAAVSMIQWRNISYATGAYMECIKYEWEVRFDIIAITIRKNGVKSIQHFKDVYFPNR